MRVEWAEGTDTMAPEPVVRRRLLEANGRPAEPEDEPECADPEPFSEEPLAIFLPAKRKDFVFTWAGRDRESGRETDVIEYRPRHHEAPTIEWEGTCVSLNLPGHTRGKVWADAESGDVLRVDERMSGMFDFRVPREQRRWSVPSTMTLESADSTVRYRRVAFSDPGRNAVAALVDGVDDGLAERGGHPAVHHPRDLELPAVRHGRARDWGSAPSLTARALRSVPGAIGITRAIPPRPVRQRPGPGVPAPARSSPASTSSDRRCPSRYPPTPAPFRRHPRPAVQQACERSALAAQTLRRLGHVPAHIVHALADQFALRCGGFSMGPTRSPALPFMVGVYAMISAGSLTPMLGIARHGATTIEAAAKRRRDEAQRGARPAMRPSCGRVRECGGQEGRRVLHPTPSPRT